MSNKDTEKESIGARLKKVSSDLEEFSLTSAKNELELYQFVKQIVIILNTLVNFYKTTVYIVGFLFLVIVTILALEFSQYLSDLYKSSSTDGKLGAMFAILTGVGGYAISELKHKRKS